MKKLLGIVIVLMVVSVPLYCQETQRHRLLVPGARSPGRLVCTRRRCAGLFGRREPGLRLFAPLTARSGRSGPPYHGGSARGAIRLTAPRPRSHIGN